MVRRKVIKKDKGSEVKADDGISEETIVMVQRLKEIVVNFSEEEIYATLLDCKMEAGLVIDRLLSQGNCEQGEDTLESLPEGVDGNDVDGEDKEKPDTSRLIGDVDQGGEDKEKPDTSRPIGEVDQVTGAQRESASLGLRPTSAASGQQHGGSYLRQSQYRNRYIPPHRRSSSYLQQEQEPYRDPSGNSYKRLGPRDKRLIKINQLTFCLAIIFLLCMAMIGFFLLFLSA